MNSGKSKVFQRFSFQVILIGVLSYAGLRFLGREMRATEDFALGLETSPYTAQDSVYPVHLIHFEQQAIDSFMAGWAARGKKAVTLFLGNSQTHAINQLKSGESNYVQLARLHDSDSEESMAVSMPNASLQELLLASYWLINVEGLPVKRLVVPVFYDDLREQGIRDSYFPIFKTRSYSLSDSLQSSKLINTWLQTISDQQDGVVEDELQGVRHTTQERSERWLNRQFSDHFRLWDQREIMRGRIFIFLYQLRNTVLGIDAQSVRRMIPERKAANLVALEDLLHYAPSMQILVYIPPLRTDISPPYDMADYRQFKNELQELCVKNGRVLYSDLQDLVPGVLWGVKDPTGLMSKPEYDFMHFRFEGHQLLDSALRSELSRFKES